MEESVTYYLDQIIAKYQLPSEVRTEMEILLDEFIKAKLNVKEILKDYHIYL
jgi:hypothetical protein